MKTNKKIISIITYIAIAMAIVAVCLYSYRNNTCVKESVFAMDTYMEVVAYGPHAKAAVNKAIEEIKRIDNELSTGNQSSAISQINSHGEGILPNEDALLLKRALEIGEATGGLFDVAIYPVMDLWGFTRADGAVPASDELKKTLELTDINCISLDNNSGAVAFERDGMAIDFGGIAKGYTSTLIMEIFEEYGVRSGMVSLGGNVQVHGAKLDHSKWKVAIADPNDQSDYLGYVEVSDDTAVITSGGYERYFEEDGKRYHHIIDPRTGYPAENGLISVSIISKDGTFADALSTSVFIMGLDDGTEYWRQHSQDFGMILCDENMQIYVTENIADSFVSERKYNIVQ